MLSIRKRNSEPLSSESSAYSLSHEGIPTFLTSILQHVWLFIPLFLHDADFWNIFMIKITSFFFSLSEAKLTDSIIMPEHPLSSPCSL